MRYYEVLLADTKYKSGAALTYSSEDALEVLSVVSVPLRARTATGFVLAETGKPGFAVKPIKSLVSPKPLPYHCLQLAQWMEAYYAVNLSEALRQFAPSKPAIRSIKSESLSNAGPAPQELQLQMHDKGEDPNEVFHQMLAELQKLNEHLSKLTSAMQADTKADQKEGGESGKPRRERKSASGSSGANAPQA